jgi:hypothetical protein
MSDNTLHWFYALHSQTVKGANRLVRDSLKQGNAYVFQCFALLFYQIFQCSALLKFPDIFYAL